MKNRDVMKNRDMLLKNVDFDDKYGYVDEKQGC